MILVFEIKRNGLEIFRIISTYCMAMTLVPNVFIRGGLCASLIAPTGDRLQLGVGILISPRQQGSLLEEFPVDSRVASL